MTHTSVQVQNTSTLVLAGATTRELLILVNDSSANLYISFNDAAEVGKGIRINANGGNIVLDNHIPAGNIYAIHSGSGDKKLLISYT